TMRVESAKMRAVSRLPPAGGAELELTFLGPTLSRAPLRSGELREQVGLKLRAENTCNLLYVMWRMFPTPSLVVSVKRNPGQNAHNECGNAGYRNLKPKWAHAAPRLQKGEPHVLRAELTGRALDVRVDGNLVWRGELDEDAASLQGPIGIRSDN